MKLICRFRRVSSAINESSAEEEEECREEELKVLLVFSCDRPPDRLEMSDTAGTHTINTERQDAYG
ncbi:hypothetical protein DPX16_22405 [Anabarilius grahami]|uniref:Uncharacterized protein n=1 Tax=Anabarilius grahami TaxID=495550 RepID=A0A3N0YYE1_ANAGA|nr:hypothetical protein DPX16_22405 [Anabarilius grahami]